MVMRDNASGSQREQKTPVVQSTQKPLALIVDN